MIITALILSLSLLIGGPVGAAAPAASGQTVQRLNRAPINTELLKVQLPRPKEEKLDNGLTVLFLPHRKVPTMHATLWVKAGALWEPKDHPGLAQFTAEMLKEGTASRTSSQLATEIEEMGASLETGAAFGKSIAQASASGMAEDADKILGLLADVTLKPSFPQDELDKYKKRRESALQEQRSQARFLGLEALYRALYGDFPAAVAAPTSESIQRTTPAALRQFHQQRWAPESSILGIAGDLTPEQAMALARKHFGSWKRSDGAAAALPPLAAPKPASVIIIDRPGSVQTDLFAGGLALRRDDPDYIPLVVANRILGGEASARLFMNLREEKGYAYGAYSNFDAELYPGLSRAWAAVRSEVTEPALRDMLAEIRRLGEETVPAAELEEAKRSLVASFAFSLEQPSTLVNYWLTTRYYGLPADYWDRYPENVAAVDAAKVRAMAQRYWNRETIQLVAVGDAEKIKKAVSGFGTVQVLDIEGRPKP